MIHKLKSVITFEESNNYTRRFWYKNTWSANQQRSRFLQLYGEEYIVDYSFTDENGYWGQRSTLSFKARDKNCFDLVRNRFEEIMNGKQYIIHSIGLA